ncbi:hypothetical protein NE235_26155 [Actinoallomurus spadix]|uniref:Uncharacterized protein n=1 Tax=Actinoallomurus spadix TaxID=79912 RepID=A0ABP3GPD3_9ACTN|nr:hypothetical protein [Actinoallomurus spadix]MCO5989598.1 hypothetical protein [Actinoallomurus spadix]
MSRNSLTERDRKTAAAAGVNGVLFSATERGGTGPVNLGVDYRKFSDAFGGNYGSRLRLLTLPACAMTAPQNPACRTQTPLSAARNMVRAQTVYAHHPRAAVSRSTNGTGG